MRRLTVLIALLFAVSGMSGLVYELAWVRLLSHLLGGTTAAISTVLACYMGGLALGSWWFGARADRVRDPLRLYAGLELGVAAAGVAVPLLLLGLKPLYVAAAPALPEAWRALLRLAIAALLLLPPTIGMGGTLPALSRFLVRRDGRLGRGLGLLYAVNTLGAVLGAALAGFVLIPQLGLWPSVGLAVSGNLIAGAGALLLGRGSTTTGPAAPAAGPAAAPAVPASALAAPAPARTAPVVAPAATPAAAAAGPGGRAERYPEIDIRLLTAAFALSGFAALGCELYWTRALQHFLGNTTYAFSAMLTTFLAGLAAGGWAGGRLADRAVSPARWLGWSQVAIGAAVALSVPLIWNALPRLEGTALFAAQQQDWSLYLLRRFLAAAAVMAVPTFLSGLAFPLVGRAAVSGLDRLGRGVGRLYSANTAGAIVGSLAAGFVVLPLLGVRRALLATAVLSAGLGAALLAGRRGRRPAEMGAALLALIALAAGAPALDRGGRTFLSDTQDPADAVLYSREDPTAETRVYRKPSGELHMSVDGHHIGGTQPGIVRKEKVLAHLPVLLTPEARRVLAVGLGSGVTLGTFALYPEVERLVCVEIVPGVIEASALFAAANHGVLRDPRVEVVLGDGIQYLLTARERFDVISSDSKLNPEFVGNSGTSAREYYQLCRQRLTEHGVFAAWFPAHFPVAQTRLVARTLGEVFPYVELFWIDPSNIVMVGSGAPISCDLDRWAERLARPAVRDDLRAQLWDDPQTLLSGRVAGRPELVAALGRRPVNTWLRPRFEFEVVRDYQRKATMYHEGDNLRWLASLWADDGLPVRGDLDPARSARFRAASRHYLEAFAAAGSTQLLARGRAHLEAGLRANPGDPRLVRVLEIVDREAAQAAANAAPADPRDVDAWLRLGVQHLEAQRHEQALACFDRALALRPGDQSVRYNRLLTLRRLGRADQVRPALADFLHDFPRDARGWSMRGRLLGEEGDLDGSLAALRRAIELDPSTAAYQSNLATTLARLERYAEAGAAFARAHELDPLYPDAAYFAAASFSRAGRTAEAARWVRVCLAKKLGDPARFLSDPNFAALRASPDWPGAEVSAAIAAGQGAAR